MYLLLIWWKFGGQTRGAFCKHKKCLWKENIHGVHPWFKKQTAVRFANLFLFGGLCFNNWYSLRGPRGQGEGQTDTCQQKVITSVGGCHPWSFTERLGRGFHRNCAEEKQSGREKKLKGEDYAGVLVTTYQTWSPSSTQKMLEVDGVVCQCLMHIPLSYL
jgi:hypothetical protein